jgi:hypothetical protein
LNVFYNTLSQKSIAAPAESQYLVSGPADHHAARAVALDGKIELRFDRLSIDGLTREISAVDAALS